MSDDSSIPNQKKTGKLTEGNKSLDTFTVRQQLRSAEAIKSYDQYLRDHKRRLRQLEKLASGELTPSSEHYR